MKNLIAVFTLLIGLAACAPVNAAIIQYSNTNTASEIYGTGDLDTDTGQFSNLALFTTVFGGDVQVFNLDPDDGFYVANAESGDDVAEFFIDNSSFPAIGGASLWTGNYDIESDSLTGNFPFSIAFTETDITPSGPVAAVPEPSTYAMLLMGLGLIGFKRGRSK